MRMAETSLVFHIVILALYGVALLVSLLRLVKAPIPGCAFPAALGAGLLAQVVLGTLRWQASGHFPVTGLFETLHCLAFCVAGVTLYFHFRYRPDAFLPGGIALVLAALAGASMGPRAVHPITPSLDTPLFLLHVAASFAAYGMFGVAGVLGIYDLIGSNLAREGAGRRMRDEALYLGYIFFSWCMIIGCIWAYLAWGSYWNWNIKGLWSFLLWFYYSGVIHIRNRTAWQGWPASLLAAAGFLLTLFTYLGLGLVFKSNHPLL
jgi:ABC-type transport system involved in cytochrome c biogenesis permease subunit